MRKHDVASVGRRQAARRKAKRAPRFLADIAFARRLLLEPLEQRYLLATITDAPPVAWYSGESGDDLVGNNDGSLQGNVQIVPGVVGQAYSFDGQSAINVYKRSNVFEPGAGDFSYEAWVKFDGTNQTGYRMLAFNYGGVPYHALYVSPQSSPRLRGPGRQRPGSAPRRTNGVG